jgi:hypothetical protein
MGILVGQGYLVKVLEVDHYICWGTPEDYETFNYWQSFFHKCAWHPYNLEYDQTIENSMIKQLIRDCYNFNQENI